MPSRLRVTNAEDAQAVLDELRRRGLPAPPTPVPEAKIAEILADQHEAQKRVDRDTSKRQVWRCSRVAGKSTKAGKKLTTAALRYPNSLVPFIAPTRKQAKLIIWNELERLNQVHHLNGHPNRTELNVTFPNKGQVMLFGADDESDIHKLRGGKYPFVYLDEAQAYGGFLRELVEDVLDPTTMFYDGTIVMGGTPNAACSGYFFEADQGIVKGWSRHHWTILDNTYIPHAAEWLERKRAEKSWTEQTPQYRREYLGQWVKSTEALVYRFEPQRNTYRELPVGNFTWLYGVAVDLGYDDPTAIVHFQWCRELPAVFVTRVLKRARMIPEQIALELRRERELHPLSFVVIDQGGGAGKMIAEEFKQRWFIDCKGAEKPKKLTFLELCNGDLQTGRIQIHESCTPLIEELKILQWDADHFGKEDERFPNDCADAFLYGYREARHYFHQPAEAPPIPGSPASFQKLAREMEEATKRKLDDQVGRKGWEW